jgi:hypothetical protein
MPVPAVADLEGIIFRRVGEYVALADLGDAMARAARQCGLSPASTTRLVDDDLLLFDAADHDKFLDVAELRAWESILGNATDVGLRDAALDDSPQAVREAAREKIKALSASVKAIYSVGLSPLKVGTIHLGFQAGGDAADSEWGAVSGE